MKSQAVATKKAKAVSEYNTRVAEEDAAASILLLASGSRDRTVQFESLPCLDLTGDDDNYNEENLEESSQTPEHSLSDSTELSILQARFQRDSRHLAQLLKTVKSKQRNSQTIPAGKSRYISKGFAC
jgi:hypothetical protein